MMHNIKNYIYLGLSVVVMASSLMSCNMGGALMLIGVGLFLSMFVFVYDRLEWNLYLTKLELEHWQRRDHHHAG